MDFAYIKRLKPFIILSMILIFMPMLTKAGGIVPTEFYGFAVTSDETVIIGDNVAVSGWKNGEKTFSFEFPLNKDYALSVNQNDNIVIYAKNARFVFAQDGTLLSFTETASENFEQLKERKIIKTTEATAFVHTTKLGFINTVTKVENGTKTIMYTTPQPVLLAELAFWLGNLLLVIVFIAGLLDVRKRRFLVDPNVKKENAENEEKEKIHLPKILRAFQKPEYQHKGAAFSSEYSSKPGEYQPFLQNENSEDETNANETEATKD